jgi:hypothetical protein
MSKYPKTLGRIEAVWNKLGGEAGVDRFLADELVVVERTAASKPALLALLGSVDVGAVPEFVARDKFTTKDTPDGVQLYWMNETFQHNFLGKVETDVPECTFQKSRLTKGSLDKPILKELGDRATISLAHLWELLKKQPKGEKGSLLTNGYANICYVEDERGTLWAVDADWYSGRGWYVDASSVSGPHDWGAASRVFSR